MPRLDPSLLQLLPGAVIGGRYEVVHRIKQGGMGAVYEVLDAQTNRRRGLKMLLPSVALDAVSRERFRKEATVSGRVESDHIVEVIDAGTDKATGADFLVMELLRGEDLGAELTRRGLIPADEALVYLSQVAAGLQKVHAEGIAHRDLKLENIFVSQRDDGSPHLKILDFGVAKVFEAETGPLQTTQVVGTPLYMAPEQLTGDALIDHRADLYSLGHLTFALLVGSAYWEPELRDSATIYRFMAAVMEGAKEPATTRAAACGVELPQGFDPWFSRATAKDPDKRYSTAIAMVLALAEALGREARAAVAHPARELGNPERSPPTATVAGGDSTTAVVGPRERTAAQSGRRLIAALAAIIVVVGGVLLWRALASEPVAVGPLPAQTSETLRAARGEVSPTATSASPAPSATLPPQASTQPSATATAATTAPRAAPRTAKATPRVAAPAAAPPRPAAAPKPAPKTRPSAPPATTAPKGGYDPLDEL